MKIIYVHTTDLAKNDTSETFVFNNAISLAEEGIESHLFITNRATTDGITLLKEKFNFHSLPENFFLHDIHLKGKSNWSFYRKVAGVLKQSAFKNAIVITRKHSVLPHLLFSRVNTQKIFFETHDFFYDLSVRKDIDKSSRRKQSYIEKIFFKKLDGLICLNRFQKELYTERLNIPVKIFPTGFRLQKIKPVEKKNILLYIGSLEERKGIENILNLAELLDKNYLIVVIGSRKTQEISSLQTEIKRRNIEDRIEVKEWQSKKYLHELINQAKIGLLPLKDGYFNEFLTVPLKYFDYAAFGLPVISSDFPSLTEYIKDGYNGYLVNWNDLHMVKEKIDGIISDEEKWKAISENQKKASEELTWKRRAIDQIAYFQEIQEK